MSAKTGLTGMVLDRRAFLGGAGFAAGAVVATSLVPLSAVHALSADLPVTSSALPPGDTWQGHVDDACGHWPPYSHPIPYGRPAFDAPALTAADVDPIDHIFLV